MSPASFRKYAVDIFRSADVGSGGVEQLGYTRVANADESPGAGKWWASKGPPSSDEQLTAAQLQQETDTEFGFDQSAIAGTPPPLTPTGKIRDDAGKWYSILGIHPRPRFASVNVSAVTVDDEPTPGTVVE